MASDSSLTGLIGSLLAFEGGELPTISSTGADADLVYDLDGNLVDKIVEVDSRAAALLETVGNLSVSINQFKDEIHFDEILIGTKFLLGPASAARSVGVALLGDKLVGEYLERAVDAGATAVAAVSLGTDYDSFAEVLGWDDGYLATIADGDRDTVVNTRSSYRKLHLGASALVGLAGELLVGLALRKLPVSREQRVTAERLGIDPKWVQADGELRWPSRFGFDGPIVTTQFRRGTRFDRYGGHVDENGNFIDTGKFASPVGTPFEQRSLPAGYNSGTPRSYEVVMDLPEGVRAGRAAPWFDQPGGGTQYQLPQSISWLLENGFIRAVD